jgi:hypothetical protein
MAVTVIVGASLVGLGAVEGLTRQFLPAFDPSGRFEFGHQIGALSLGQPGTRARQTKNTGDFDVFVVINRHGLRDSNDVSQATPEDLVVVGDSFAWGWGVEEEQRFSSVVAKRTRIHSFNVSSPTNLEGYLELLQYSRSLGANVGRLLVAVCMENDLGLYAPRAREATSSQVSWPLQGLKAWLERHSASYLLATTVVHRSPWLNALAVRAGLIIPNLEGISRNEDAWEVVESSADMTLKIAGGYGTLVMLIPSRGLWIGSHRATEDRVDRWLVAALAKRAIDVLDLRPLFEASGPPLDFHFSHDGHWNSRGHELAAQAIIERLGILGFDPTPHSLRR